MPAGLIAAAVAGTAAVPPPEAWFTPVVGFEENAALLREAATDGSPRGWITAADIPADAAPGAGSLISLHFRLEIGADGTLTHCTPETPGALADIACAKLRERGKFVAALDRQGRPAADTLHIALVYAAAPAPPAPPAPPMPSGIPNGLMFVPANPLVIAREPEWGKFLPRDRSRQTEVAVSIFRYPVRGVRQISCYALAPSNDRTVDDATCQALKSAQYRDVPDGFGSMTALVIWKGNRARIEKPHRARGTDLVFDRAAAEQMVAALPAGPRPGRARLTFAANGKSVRCKVTVSTGSDAADLAACRQLETIRYKPAIDIYDRSRDGTQSIAIGTGVTGAAG
jgi:hypothetical protein